MKRKYNDINKQDLHIDGFVIHKNVFIPETTTLENYRLKALKARKIFNTDNLRSQIQINEKDVDQNIINFLKENYSNHILNEWNIIKSKPGCNIQQAHCDYVPDQNMSLTDDNDMPLSAIISFMKGTKITIWRKSIRYSFINSEYIKKSIKIYPEEIYLNPGDILVFRADLVHAGSNYNEENIRLHVYLDNDKVPRTKNRTWIIREHASEKLKNIFRK